MPDSLVTILARYNDNTAGDISAADGRANMTGLWRQIHAPYSVDNAADVWWQGDSAGMTTVTITGTQTITEIDGHLSVRFSGQSSGDFNGLFKAHTFSVGDSFATRIRSMGTSEDYTMTGIAFTNGTVGTSDIVAAYPYRQVANGVFNAGHGTLTNFATNSWNLPGMFYGGPFNDAVYARITYTASNSFTIAFSPDGVSWSSFGQAAVSKTMTPTHFGVIWSKFGGAVESLASFGPVCKLA